MNISIKDIKAAFFLIFFSVGVAFLFNHLSPNGIALFGQWDIQKGVISATMKNNAQDLFLEIDQPMRVKRIVENSERTVLDVRHQDFYDMGHIPGAQSFPLQNFQADKERLLQTIKKNTPILVYCSGYGCDASHMFANQLTASGYKDVKVFPGGFNQWREMGFEIQKNEE